MKKIIFVFALLFFACAYASADGLAVSPSRIDILIERNSKAESAFSVTNAYNYAIEVDVTTYDWNTYKGNGSLDVSSWMKIPQTHIALEPGETKQVPFTVETSNTMVGSVSCQVSFATRSQGGGFILKISNPVYLVIRGTEKVSFAVSNVAVQGGDGKDIVFSVFLKNSGNVHVRPSGKMTVYDSKKKDVYTTDIPEIYPSYAGTDVSQPFVAKIPASLNLAPGLYKAKIYMTARGKTVKKKIKFRIKSDNSVIY